MYDVTIFMRCTIKDLRSSKTIKALRAAVENGEAVTLLCYSKPIGVVVSEHEVDCLNWIRRIAQRPLISGHKENLAFSINNVAYVSVQDLALLEDVKAILDGRREPGTAFDARVELLKKSLAALPEKKEPFIWSTGSGTV